VAVPEDAPTEAEISLEDPGASVPDFTNAKPRPRPVDRIAPEAVTNPEPSTEIAEQFVPEVSDAAETPSEAVEEAPAAAPQEAVTEIVTEAEEPAGFSPSSRPKSRPASVVAAARQAAERANQAAQAEAAADAKAAAESKVEAERQAAADAQSSRDAAEVAAQAAADAAAALVAEAVGAEAAPERPTGPPLTSGEREGLRVAVSQCWNTGSMSTEAQRTTVNISMSMNQDGTPQSGSIRLVGSSGGSAASAEQAFQTARRAIIICGKQGFPLPQDKYAQWQTIEMTFDPEKMRFK
jgi:hypothetical protein